MHAYELLGQVCQCPVRPLPVRLYFLGKLYVAHGAAQVTPQVVRPRSVTGNATSFRPQQRVSRGAQSYALLRRSITRLLYFAQKRDINEGADIIMVKPALPYLDIIQDAAELASDLPLACYQVSGEYAMVVAGARAGVYDLRTMAFETADSFLRAGAY